MLLWIVRKETIEGSVLIGVGLSYFEAQQIVKQHNPAVEYHHWKQRFMDMITANIDGTWYIISIVSSGTMLKDMDIPSYNPTR